MAEEPTVRAHLGKILVPRHDREDGWVDEAYTPDAARALARQLNDAAQDAYLQLAAIRSACAGGHLWGDGFNSLAGDKHTVYYCTRDGCEVSKDEPGWLPFEPKLHYVPFAPTPRDCTGPGCDYCSDEALSEAIHKMFAAAAADLSIRRDGLNWWIAAPGTEVP